MKYKSQLKKLRHKKFLSGLYQSGAVKAVIQRSARLIPLQIMAALLVFANNYIVIKLCGEKVYGSYVSLLTWVNIFSVLVVFGFDDYFIAALPAMYFKSETKTNVLFVLVRSLIILFTVYCAVTIVLMYLFYAGFFEKIVYENEIYFFLLLLEISVLALLIAFFRGIDKIISGQLIDKLLRPGLMILFTALLFILVKQVTLQLILMVQITVLLAAIIFIITRLQKQFSAFQSSGDRFTASLKTNAAFLFISILNLLSVRLDILFLTKTVAPEQVGYYNIGVRMADVIGFPLAALNLVVPTFLSKAHANKSQDIRKLIGNTSFIAFLVTLLIYLPAVFLGKYVLPLFGKHFTEGYWPMVILGGTYLVSSASHQMNGYLMVSGHQNLSLICLLINVVSVFIFCRGLIPAYGLTGAAFSVLLGSVIYLIAIFIVYNKTTSRIHQKPVLL